jgi:hypothetical protein
MKTSRNSLCTCPENIAKFSCASHDVFTDAWYVSSIDARVESRLATHKKVTHALAQGNAQLDGLTKHHAHTYACSHSQQIHRPFLETKESSAPEVIDHTDLQVT